MTPSLHAVKIGGILILASLFSACVPVPYDAIVAPDLSGTVHRDGKPVENAVVFLEAPRGDGCSFTGGVSIRTDRNGRFQFEEQKGFQFFGSGGSMSHFQICIVDGSIKHQGWYERKLRGMSEKLTLDCNVQSPLPVFQDTLTGKVMGICRAKRSY